MAGNCPYWKDDRCVTPKEGDTGPCSYSGSDYQSGCAVFRLTAAKLAGKGTFEALQEAGGLSPFGFYTVIDREGKVSHPQPKPSPVRRAEETEAAIRPPPSGLAIAAFTLGILGIVPCWGIPLAVTGIILGIIAIARRMPGRGLAIGGIVAGILTVLPETVVLCVYLLRAGRN